MFEVIFASKSSSYTHMYHMHFVFHIRLYLLSGMCVFSVFRLSSLGLFISYVSLGVVNVFRLEFFLCSSFCMGGFVDDFVKDSLISSLRSSVIVIKAVL